MFIVFKRIFKSGWIGFFRNSGLSIATVFIMIMTISLISLLFLFQEISQFLISFLEEKVDISVYFRENTLEKDHLDIKKEVSKISGIKNIKYISREEALEKFIQKHKDNLVLMESLNELGRNPFLASLNIQTFEAAQYLTIMRVLETESFKNLIEKDDYYQKKPIIEKIFSFTSKFNLVGIILSLILAIVAVLVAFNTIRLTIYNLREEIKIQRLVGASNWFIRGPFLVQGAISGFFAFLISLFIFALICWIFSPKIETLVPGLNIFNYFINNFFTLSLIQLVVGIGLGIFSSIIAIRKYLKI